MKLNAVGYENISRRTFLGGLSVLLLTPNLAFTKATMYFAGEACHDSMWATAAGAYLSGEYAAQKLIGGKILSN